MNEVLPTANQGADASSNENGGGQFLTFIMEKEEYGVNILNVVEIRGWEKPTPLPSAPEYVKGVINLRGAIIPIIDLRQRFSMPAIEYSPTTVIVILQVVTEGR